MVAVGDNVVFICAMSKTPMIFTWMRGSKIIQNTSRIRINHEELAIQNVQQSDAGSYTCNIKTLHGSRKKTASLTIVKKGN